MRQRLPHGFLPAIVACFALGIIHLRCEAAAVRVRKDRLRVIEVGLHADIFARFILYDSCFRRLQQKMGLKRPMGILQNQTSGLLQLILYKRHGKVVGDTLFFERLTQGVTEEAHAHRSHF